MALKSNLMKDKLLPKFVCDAVQEFKQGDQPPIFSVSLYPVKSNGEDNNRVFRGEPVARIILSDLNKAYAEQFEGGKEYYLELTPVK